MTTAAPAEAITADTAAMRLDDPIWRLNNLYKIIVKGDDDDDNLVIQFRLNRAQKRLVARLHNRNIVLKARQLGFTTLIAILWLDTALFSKNPVRCGVIAHDREAAEVIFRDKVRFAYNNLPEALREAMPLQRDSATELLFAHNNASVRVATSMRSGTLHRLHISEFGKISAKAPDKAREVVTGSIPAVPKNGILVIESTAEGQDGHFYDMTQRSMGDAQARKVLGKKDYKFHFFPWWEEPAYSLDPTGVVLTPVNLAYFNELEPKISRRLTAGQKAWYVSTLRNDFSDDAPLMWQEYPSTPEEAFQVSTEGCYYAAQIAAARKAGRIRPNLPFEKALPVNTFWDLGRGDWTAIWFHQRVGPENRFVGYYENSGEELNHYAQHLQDRGWIYGKHWLPHDAEYKRLGETPDTNRSQKEMLESLLPEARIEVVPRISLIGNGIQAVRNVFGSCWFDEQACDQGLKRLANYRKEWNKTRGCWKDEPLHDDNSHGADAFRQFGQAADAGEMFASNFGAVRRAGRPGGNRRQGSSMAA